MGSGSSGLTPRYNAVKQQLNATYELNKALKDDGYSPAPGLYDANRKAKANGIIDTPAYNRYVEINKKANKAKHEW